MLFVTVTGNLGRDAETKTVGTDNVTTFSVASSKKVKGDETTTWVDCELWGKRGETLAQYLNKGTQVTAVGELTTYTSEKTGKTYLKCRVNDVALQGGKRSAQPETATAPAPQEQDDIPF